MLLDWGRFLGCQICLFACPERCYTRRYAPLALRQRLFHEKLGTALAQLHPQTVHIVWSVLINLFRL